VEKATIAEISPHPFMIQVWEDCSFQIEYPVLFGVTGFWRHACPGGSLHRMRRKSRICQHTRGMPNFVNQYSCRRISCVVIIRSREVRISFDINIALKLSILDNFIDPHPGGSRNSYHL
jgi:hypothetical protein